MNRAFLVLAGIALGVVFGALGAQALPGSEEDTNLFEGAVESKGESLTTHEDSMSAEVRSHIDALERKLEEANKRYAKRDDEAKALQKSNSELKVELDNLKKSPALTQSVPGVNTNTPNGKQIALDQLKADEIAKKQAELNAALGNLKIHYGSGTFTSAELKPADKEALRSTIRDPNADVNKRLTALRQLAMFGEDADWDLIKSLKYDPNERIASEALVQDMRHSRPATGYLVDSIAGGQAKGKGLKRGDIITHYDGVEVKDTNTLREAKNKVPDGGVARATIYRDGSVFEVTLDKGQIGVNGGAITKK